MKIEKICEITNAEILQPVGRMDVDIGMRLLPI